MTLVSSRPNQVRRSFPFASPARPRRVLHAVVVHPIAVIRAGLRVVLGDAAVGQVSGAASTFDALRLAADHHPDVILFDFSTGDGPAAARLFAGLWPRPVLVALVSPGSAIGPRECLDGGVDAAIALEGATDNSILDTVRMALDGRGPAVSGFRPGHPAEHMVVTDTNPTSVLTRREREMLHLIGEGLSNREIAEVLGLSVKTVEAHRGNMSRKLNIRTRSGLMRVAMSALVG